MPLGRQSPQLDHTLGSRSAGETVGLGREGGSGRDGGKGTQTVRLYQCPNCGEKTISFRGRFFASRLRPAHCTACAAYLASKPRFIATLFTTILMFVTFPVAMVLAAISIWAFLGAILLLLAVSVFIMQGSARLVPVKPAKARWWNKPLWGKRDSGSPPTP